MLCQVHWISFQTHCPRCKSREAGCSYVSLHNIINVCVRRPLMAANPISATEIKSCWRQRSSPSLINNDFAFGVFMKMMDHQNCSFISSPTSTRVLIPCFPFCVFPPHSLFISCRFERVVGGVDEIKEQQRRAIINCWSLERWEGSEQKSLLREAHLPLAYNAFLRSGIDFLKPHAVLIRLGLSIPELLESCRWSHFGLDFKAGRTSFHLVTASLTAGHCQD